MNDSDQDVVWRNRRIRELEAENQRLREWERRHAYMVTAIRMVLAMNRPIAADARRVLQEAVRGEL